VTIQAGLFFDFHFPLSLVHLIEELLGLKNFDPKNPAVPIDTSTREWYSQPRVSTDATTEVITINYKLPLSVSEFSADILRKSCHVEVWYRDRSNNWRQMLDRQRVPLALDLSQSDAQSWYKYKSSVYPIVAKSVQVRVRRTPDPSVANAGVPYSVGLRDILVKRNVYERNQGVLNLEDEQDVLGNVISKYIKDWDASKAVDADAVTFWRSGPQPDPSAVVSLYLDVRNQSGDAQTIDRLYIDPVHSGQHLNIYHSVDETVGTRKLSPIAVMPDEDTNTDWRVGVGRWDLRAAQPSRYAFSSYWGPQFQKDAWVGIEWTPDFDATDGPSQPSNLLKVTATSTQLSYSPEISYEPGGGLFRLIFRRDGYSPITYTAGIGQTFLKDEPLKIVVGWAYGPSRIFIKVTNRRGETVALTEAQSGLLPNLVSFDGQLEFSNFRGLLTATAINMEDYASQADTFLANPTVYVSPEPVLPDEQGNIPASSLDNSIYAADWTQQQHGIGGPDSSEFAEKTWTPIWKNFVAEKGMLFFPQMVATKYIKLEFTNLTEEPYPIYESGIDVSYKVFPISVQQVATTGPRLYTGSEVGGLFGVANLNGIKSLNIFNPLQVINAVGTIVTPQYEPVRVDTGPGYVTTAVPHLNDSPISNTYRLELSKTAIYRRDQLAPYVLAQDAVSTTIKGEGLIKLQPYTNIPWQEIYAANPGAIETRQSIGAVPVRGTNWWIFPGQELKVPASVMERLTSTSTVTERRATLERRVRFTTSAVHRYDIRTVRRDAAVAYFAGVREVIPFVASYIFGQDKDSYDFPLYSDDQWALTNVRTTLSGPITWDGNGDMGTAYFSFQTQSNFAKLFAEFRDSGLVRSDALWASANSDQLVPGASIIPESPDGAAWLDSFVDWTDATVGWGAPRGVVAVNLDGDRRYQGRRVLKFTRVAGAGEAGIRLQQETNFIEGALFRLGCVVYKPIENDNILLIRLVRRSDGVIVHESPVELTTNRWIDFTTPLLEVPDGTDQDYDLELVLTGDDADELYVSDLYSELALVRYFMRAGDATTPLYEVTDLRYQNSAQVVAQTPVHEGTIQVSIVSPKGFAYGVRATPAYLQ
jgi:hypothetical protein